MLPEFHWGFSTTKHHHPLELKIQVCWNLMFSFSTKLNKCQLEIIELGILLCKRNQFWNFLNNVRVRIIYTLYSWFGLCVTKVWVLALTGFDIGQQNILIDIGALDSIRFIFKSWCSPLNISKIFSKSHNLLSLSSYTCKIRVACLPGRVDVRIN